jgi:hypothetical protein
MLEINFALFHRVPDTASGYNELKVKDQITQACNEWNDLFDFNDDEVYDGADDENCDAMGSEYWNELSEAFDDFDYNERVM